MYQGKVTLTERSPTKERNVVKMTRNDITEHQLTTIERLKQNKNKNKNKKRLKQKHHI